MLLIFAKNYRQLHLVDFSTMLIPKDGNLNYIFCNFFVCLLYGQDQDLDLFGGSPARDFCSQATWSRRPTEACLATAAVHSVA